MSCLNRTVVGQHHQVGGATRNYNLLLAYNVVQREQPWNLTLFCVYLILDERNTAAIQIYVLWATRDRHMIKHFAPLMLQCNCTIWFTNTDGDAANEFTKLQLELSAGAGADDVNDAMNCSDNGHESIGISAASDGLEDVDAAACVPLVLENGRSVHATVCLSV